MYYCLDGYNTANGFRGRTILFNRTTLSLLQQKVDKLLTQKCKPVWCKKVSRHPGIRRSNLRLHASSSSPIRNCEFPELILRFDSRAHSDDNYAYVTPVEG